MITKCSKDTAMIWEINKELCKEEYCLLRLPHLGLCLSNYQVDGKSDKNRGWNVCDVHDARYFAFVDSYDYIWDEFKASWNLIGCN